MPETPDPPQPDHATGTPQCDRRVDTSNLPTDRPYVVIGHHVPVATTKVRYTGDEHA